MKIIIAGPAHPLRGGIASFNERLASEFLQQGHEIEIFNYKLQYPKLLFPGKTQYSEAPAPKALKIRQKLNSINPLNWEKVGREIKKLKPDLLIFRFWLPFMAPCQGRIAEIVKSNKHTKILVIVDNAIPHDKKPGDKFFTKYFFKKADAFISLSEIVGADIRKIMPDAKPLVIPHPVYDNYGESCEKEFARKQLDISSEQKVLLFFGLVRAYKGLDLLIETLARPELRAMNLMLLVAGEFYDDEQKYRQLIEKHDLSKNIRIRNEFIKDEEVKLYFGAADLIVQPYKSATQSGISQMALHFEKPILVTDVGGLKEFVSHQKSGYLVSAEPESIAESIQDFFENERESEMVSFVKSFKEHFSWSKMTDGIAELYAQIS